MASEVERFVSPEGDRIAFVDLESGEVWMMKRLGPADAAGTVAILPKWARVTPGPSESRRRQRRQAAG
jgi:hypothetical protein